MSKASCPFCALPAERILILADEALVIRDAFPVSPGHTLVIPRRHIGSFFDLSDAERTCVVELLAQAKAQLDLSFQPDGFNIGINDGAAAGQTVQHLHLHLIPRFLGDVPDPRGGVRWVMPGKAKYWVE
ncbi:HIT family protein [Thauera sp.]|uniref:HIT family protein n=1 Tax=Thauera sp. TaxID=1905334 RepID=UPI002C32A9B6|nr:HIT family protein [Thauera sp.]HRP25537.1 HIT family protein [Thauera sp.]